MHRASAPLKHSPRLTAQRGSKRLSRPQPARSGPGWSLTACRHCAGARGLASPPHPTRHSISVVKYLEHEKKTNQTHICRAQPVGFLPETCGPAFSHIPLTCSSDLTERHPLGRAGAWPAARGQCPPLSPSGWAVKAPVGTTPHLPPMAPSLQRLAKTQYLLCLPGTYDPKGRQRRNCRQWGRAPWSEHPHCQRVSQAGTLTKRERQSVRVAPTVHTTKEGTEAKPEEGTGWGR